jgi:hypothetical protein
MKVQDLLPVISFGKQQDSENLLVVSARVAFTTSMRCGLGTFVKLLSKIRVQFYLKSKFQSLTRQFDAEKRVAAARHLSGPEAFPIRQRCHAKAPGDIKECQPDALLARTQQLSVLALIDAGD